MLLDIITYIITGLRFEVLGCQIGAKIEHLCEQCFEIVNS